MQFISNDTYNSLGEDVYISKNTVIKHKNLSNIGNHVAIDDYLYASCPLSIGNYVHIASHVTINGGRNARVYIGDFVGIGTGTRLICGSSDFLNGGIIASPVLPKHLSGMKTQQMEPIRIEDFVSIGANCTILNGVTLVKGSSIAAGSVVTKDTEPWTLYKGVPAKPYKILNREKKLEEARSLGYPFFEKASQDAEQYHQCIYHQGNTNNPRGWHQTNMSETVRAIEKYLESTGKKEITILDYGSGTGGSIIETLKLLKDRNIKYRIFLLDILESWFSKAYELMKDDLNIEFILASRRENGKFKPIPLSECFHHKADIVLCSNMIHLIPEKKRYDVFNSIKKCMKSDGLFVANSGNIRLPREIQKYCFDDPFKSVSNTKMKDKIFPTQPELQEMTSCLSEVFDPNDQKTRFTTVNMKRSEVFDFFMIPRLVDNLVKVDKNVKMFINDKLREMYPDNLEFIWTTFIIQM